MHTLDSVGCPTRAAILDTAERLFATSGFEATSLREITAEAGANLGAVNYHFKSKDGLILAVLRRMFHPVNQRRLALLSELENAPKPPSIEAILEALFRPPLELISRPGESGWFFPRLLTYCITQPGSYLKPLVEEEFAAKTRKFYAALQRVCPELGKAEVRWRLHLSIGAFIHTAGNPELFEIISEGMCKVNDPEAVLRQVVTFCAAGFRAKAAGE